MNEARQVVLAYRIDRCWMSEYVALPALDADADAGCDPAHPSGKRRMGARELGGRAERAWLTPFAFAVRSQGR
jgi:hypothetical protein